MKPRNIPVTSFSITVCKKVTVISPNNFNSICAKTQSASSRNSDTSWHNGAH